LFGTECKGKDLHCQVGDSMIIWSDSIVHKCPFRAQMPINCKEKNWNFLYSTTLNWCGDKIFSTAEGVYIRFSDFLDDYFYKNTNIIEGGHDLLDYEYNLKTNIFLITFIELSIASNHLQNI